MRMLHNPYEMGDRIRIVRTENGLSQQKLADKMDVNVQYVYQVENGIIKSPGIDMVIRIAKALNVPLGWLVLGDAEG